MQELFFSGAIPPHSLPQLNESSRSVYGTDNSGRGTLWLLHRNEPTFLLANHWDDPDRSHKGKPVPMPIGASSSHFCYVPYGQAGGYGGRYDALLCDRALCSV